MKLKKYFTAEKLINYLLLYRIIMSFVAEFVIAKMTKLGDVYFYMNHNPIELLNQYGFKVLFDRYALPQFIVSSIRSVAGYDVLCYAVCSLVGYVGIRYFLKTAALNSKSYILLILLCYSPSFTIWSSIAGRNTFVVFAMGIICAELIRFFRGEKIKSIVLLLIAAWIIAVMKPQYIPFIIFIIPYITIRQNFNFSWVVDLSLLVGISICIAVSIYFFRFQIDDYALQIHYSFRETARSTRPQIFIEQFDFFKKMLYLMPLSLWGPTIAECKKSILHVFTVIENIIILICFAYMLKGFFRKLFKEFKIYCQWLLVSINSLFLLFFAHYIQGVMNSGAAIRYRTNIYLVIIAFVYLFSIIKEKNNISKIEAKKALE